MYGGMGVSAPSLHRESTASLIRTPGCMHSIPLLLLFVLNVAFVIIRIVLLQGDHYVIADIPIREINVLLDHFCDSTKTILLYCLDEHDMLYCTEW